VSFDELQRLAGGAMTDRLVYHLALTRSAIEGATLALLPGDPGRVESIARSSPFTDAREVASKREYRTWIARAGAAPVLVTSTGIGGPSTSIAVDELAQIGVTTFIRVGTTGAIQADIDVGDVIVTTGAVRLDGASIQYAPVEYPAVAHHEIVSALVRAAADLGVPARTGVTCTCDTFYPGQERNDSFTGYVPRRFQGITEEWRRLGVLNYEMEAATLLTLASTMGLRGGCVAGVVVSRPRGEHVTPDALARGERNAVNVGVAAAVRLLSGKP
jgi:uridine phosphorylase